MKVQLLLLLLCALLLVPLSQIAAQDPLAPDGTPKETYFAPFPVPVTLDGDLSDWNGVPRVLMSDDGDPEIEFAAAADETHLYFMADITDSNIISGEHGTNYWNEDSVEFYLNASGNLKQVVYADGIAQITIPAMDATLPSDEAVIVGTQGDTANATVSATLTDMGWAVEIAVPLKNGDIWEITPGHGVAIGFQVHLNGAHNSNRDTKLIWSAFDKSDQSYQNPSVFGTLMFYEVGRTDIPEMVFAPEEIQPTPIPVGDDVPFKDSSLPVEERLADLMGQMTLDEKIGQMTLVEKNSITNTAVSSMAIGGILSGGGGYPDPNTPEAWAEMVNGFQEAAMNSRLAIPIIYGVDAVHGHNNMRGAVIFPHNIGLGATRDPELVEQVCQTTAQEMIATGIYWNYAPVVAVAQDIRWGRTYESFGENTELVTELAIACMKGLQGESLDDPGSVLASVKHFVGDGGAVWGTSTTGEYQIDQGVTDIDEATLRAIHLPPYIEAINNGAQNIMVSFSSWGGLKMHAQKYLITDVLKGELGFTGFVVSDWAGMDQVSTDYYEAIVTSINAGVDMNMVPYDYNRFIQTVKVAVERGDISMERIDDAVTRILKVKLEMGLFEHPYADETLLPAVGSDEHRALARQAVAESQVLLKNDGDVLPIAPDTPTVFVSGVLADNLGVQLGGWSIEWQGDIGDVTEGTTILEGIRAAASPTTRVEYDKTGQFADMVDASGNLIKADVGIAVVGELPYAEGVGDDPDLAISPKMLVAVDALRERCDKLVVIIVSGRPMVIADSIEAWDAVIAAWLPGTEGAGVADVLFGYQPFSGKTPFSWPRSADQLPLANMSDPLFPFGFGLETSAIQVVSN